MSDASVRRDNRGQTLVRAIAVDVEVKLGVFEGGGGTDLK